MAKRFFACSLDQPFLLPPSLRDWLPESHLACFIADLMSQLDLGAIYADYDRRDGRGHPAYHPEMMTRLLLYAYAIGEPSSRKIEQATRDSIAFRFLAANQTPDHSAIAEFRRRHLTALAQLFVQVLRICDKAGLVKLGQIAIDGTKVKANATKRRSISYERLSKREQYWRELVDKLLAEAQQTDARENETADAAEPSLPEKLAQAETRLAEIRAAKQAIEEEAKQKLAEAAQAFTTRGKRGQPVPSDRDPVQHKRAKRAYYRARKAAKEPKASYNFTEPESRLMQDGATQTTVQAYNAQIAVDGQAQIIVAVAVTNEANDRGQLEPMVEAVKANLDRLPEWVLADNGYWNTEQIEKLQQGQDGHDAVKLLVPPESDVEAGPTRSSPQNAVADAMREQLKSEAGRALYSRRQTIVEPVFGVSKQVRGFRQFSFRGRRKCDAEWQLISLTHNVRKLHRQKFPLPPRGPKRRRKNGRTAPGASPAILAGQPRRTCRCRMDCPGEGRVRPIHLGRAS